VPEVSDCAIKSPHKASFELMFGRVAKSEIGEDVAGASGTLLWGDMIVCYATFSLCPIKAPMHIIE